MPEGDARPKLNLSDLPIEKIAELVRPLLAKNGQEYILAGPDHEFAMAIKFPRTDGPSVTEPIKQTETPVNAVLRPPVGGSPIDGPVYRYLTAGNRTRVTPITSWPNSTNVYLSSTQGACSGTVIGANVILTAAHCVYAGGFFTVWAYPGADHDASGNWIAPWGYWTTNPSDPGTSRGSFNMVVPGCYDSAGDYDCDYAILDFSGTSIPVGNAVGWRGTNWGVWNSSNASGSMTKWGYPGDQQTLGPELWQSAGTFYGYQTSQPSYYHTSDQVQGDSGGGAINSAGQLIGNTTHHTYTWFFGWEYSNYGRKFNNTVKTFVSNNSTW